MYPYWKVADIMSRDIHMASPKLTIREAAKIMSSKGIGSLIIVDEDCKPLGIFTDRDVVRAVADKVDLDKTPVEQYMTKSIITVKADTPVHVAAQLMREKRIRHLPVVDDQGRLQGIVTVRDLSWALARLMEAVTKYSVELECF